MAEPTREQIEQIKRLLAERGQATHDAAGIQAPRWYYPSGTFVEVATIVGVKAAIVSEVAHGTYTPHRPTPRPDGPPIHQNQREAVKVRCPGCRALVYPPCVLCELNGTEPRA